MGRKFSFENWAEKRAMNDIYIYVLQHLSGCIIKMITRRALLNSIWYIVILFNNVMLHIYTQLVKK